VSGSGVATIRVEARDDVAVLAVSVEVYKPGFRVPDTKEGETPELPVDRVALRNGGSGVYESRYTGFDEPGAYRLVAYASDNDGNMSLPLQAMTYVGEQRKTYLPLVSRQY
jgi:hypothetical protein